MQIKFCLCKILLYRIWEQQFYRIVISVDNHCYIAFNWLWYVVYSFQLKLKYRRVWVKEFNKLSHTSVSKTVCITVYATNIHASIIPWAQCPLVSNAFCVCVPCFLVCARLTACVVWVQREQLWPLFNKVKHIKMSLSPLCSQGSGLNLNVAEELHIKITKYTRFYSFTYTESRLKLNSRRSVNALEKSKVHRVIQSYPFNDECLLKYIGNQSSLSSKG